MTLTVDRTRVRRGQALDASAIAQLFTEARTHNAFHDLSVPDALLRKALDLAKMGPTAANQQPLRVLFLRSTQAKKRPRPALMPGNVGKTMAAPVVAVMGYDVEFYEHLPFLFPHVDAKSWFAGNPEFAARSAAQNGTLQVAYFILALRAVGLDAGPIYGLRPDQGRAGVLPRRQDQSQRHYQYRLRRRRQAVPAQPTLLVRPDGNDPLKAATLELNMNLLTGKGAVVTAAASGIGKVIETAFIEAGASVQLCDIFWLLSDWA